MWLLKASVADSAARQWLLIAVSHVLLYDVKETLLPTKRIFWDCCRNIGYFLCGVEMVKPYVNARLHCIVSSLKWASKMSALPINGKISVNAYACVVYVYNVTSALYCAINKPFLCYSTILCCNLSVNMSLDVRFNRNRVCMKIYTHICGANMRRLKPIYTVCNTCEFLENNYCIPKRWPMGPIQQSLPPPGSNL